MLYCPECKSKLNISIISDDNENVKGVSYECLNNNKHNSVINVYSLQEIINEQSKSKLINLNDNKKYEEEFWGLVEYINWKENYQTHNYHLTVKDTILWQMDNQKKLKETYKDLYKKMINVFDKYIIEEKNQKFHLSAETTEIFISFIIGLGKTEYYKHLNDPSILYKKTLTEECLYPYSFKEIFN